MLTQQEIRDIKIEQDKKEQKQKRDTKQNNNQLFKKFGSEYFIANDIKDVR